MCCDRPSILMGEEGVTSNITIHLHFIGGLCLDWWMHKWMGRRVSCMEETIFLFLVAAQINFRLATHHLVTWQSQVSVTHAPHQDMWPTGDIIQEERAALLLMEHLRHYLSSRKRMSLWCLQIRVIVSKASHMSVVHVHGGGAAEVEEESIII